MRGYSQMRLLESDGVRSPVWFADYPMDFEVLYKDSKMLPLGATAVRVASIDHLIAIKRAAGRPKDLDDANRLAELRGGNVVGPR
jgi:hypothetical protein